MNSKLTFGDKIMLLCDDCRSMTEWELEFIDSMELKRSKGETFSKRQVDKINIIYDKRM